MSEFDIEKLKKEQEKIKEKVKKFKKEKGGLLPELFGIPGEEIKREQEYPEEYYLAYKLRKLLTETPIGEIKPDIQADEKFKKKTIEEAMRNETLWKNAVDMVIEYLNQGRQEKHKPQAWYAFLYYYSLKSSNLWSEIKEKFPDKCEEIEKGIRSQTLWENMLDVVIEDLIQGQQIGNTRSVWYAFLYYYSLKSSNLWSEMKEKFPDKCEEIEKGIKNKTLWENMVDGVIEDLIQGQQKVPIESSSLAFLGYSLLLFFLSDLEKTAEKKLKQQELEKALHPEKQKDIPPRPESRSF